MTALKETEEMGIGDREGVVVQLAGVETACWVMGELLPGLMTAWVVL